MPLNEASAARNNFTAKQRREQLAAIYGLKDPMNPTEQFTPQEIERMRQMVQMHDRKSAVNNFDINNPPRQNYVHQHFPKLVYNLDAEGQYIHKLVHDEDEWQAAIAAGWANEPKAAPADDGPELDAETKAEAARLDATAKKKKK